jgi:hypothetical protein
MSKVDNQILFGFIIPRIYKILVLFFYRDDRHLLSAVVCGWVGILDLGETVDTWSW